MVNYTIDDSQWATPALSLSPGWNMLRTNGDNEYINSTQVANMTPLLSNFWNQSISWTTSVNSSTTLTFVGSDIWAYGISGPDQGKYTVTVDNHTLGIYDAEAKNVDYHHLLYAGHGFTDGESHTLTLMNTVEGSYLAFDVAIIITGEKGSPSLSTPTTSNIQTPSTTPASVILNLLPTQYTPEQLESLETPYKFHWNSAAYFVVAFSALVVLLLNIVVMKLFVKSQLEKRRRSKETSRSVAEGKSYLIHRGKQHKKPRPGTRLLDALRGRNISAPKVEEGFEGDGSSLGGLRSSEAGSYGDGGGSGRVSREGVALW